MITNYCLTLLLFVKQYLQVCFTPSANEAKSVDLRVTCIRKTKKHCITLLFHIAA